MNFLLDTNVIREPMKVRPNARVLAWLAEVDEDSVFLSVVTITELRYGVERLATGRGRNRLDGWLRKDLSSRFKGRILPIDLEIADACGRLVARSESAHRPIERKSIPANSSRRGAAPTSGSWATPKLSRKRAWRNSGLAIPSPSS